MAMLFATMFVWIIGCITGACLDNIILRERSQRRLKAPITDVHYLEGVEEVERLLNG